MPDASVSLGLDAGAFDRELSAAQQRFSASAKGMAAGAHGAGAAGTRAFGDLINAVTQSSGSVMELNALTHTLGLSLGAAAGVAIGVKLVEGLSEASDRARILREEVMKLTAPTGSAEFTTINALMASFDDLEKKIDEIRGKSKLGMNSFFDFALSSHLLGGSGYDAVLKERSDQIGKLQGAQRDRLSKTADKISAGADVTDTKSRAGDFAGQRAELLAKFKEAQGEIEANKNKPGAGAELSKLLDATSKQYLADSAALEQREAATKRVAALEEKITQIKRGGFDLDVKIAEAKLRAAQTEANIGPHDQATGNANPELLAKMHEAEEALREAQNKANLAPLVGPSPEEVRKLRAEQSGQKFSAIDATTGRGQAEELRARQAKLAEAKRAQDQLVSSTQPNAAKDEKIEAQKNVNELTKAIDEQKDARAKTLREAEAETKEIDAQLHHHQALADALRTEAEFAEKIKQAQKDGHPEDVANLQRQLQLTQQLRQQKAEIALADESKLTLGEAAGKYGHGLTGSRARRAQRLEEQSKTSAGKGNLDRAADLHTRAEQLKQSIGGLKSTETQPFKDALDACQVLRDIKTNTGKPIVNGGGK